jgi:alkylresorcinol/alkylpyrone synthase
MLLGSGSKEIERLLPAFRNAGIERRYSCVPITWHYDVHDWASRNSVYLSSALDLLEAATRDALNRANLSSDDIDSVVVVSTTGIATPSLDALLIERMNFKRTVRRLPIFGLGCAGGAIGLARAASLAAQGDTVLFLVVELCTLSFHRNDLSKSNVIAAALFGDGAAAVILSENGNGPAIMASGEHTWPGTLDVMGWDVIGNGLKAIFSRDIPALVATSLREPIVDFLAHCDLQLTDVEQFICHPGGAKVLDALEDAFGLAPGALLESREVLRDYGNMSAATVIFVLERVLGTSSRRGPYKMLLNALGPGFTAGFVLLDQP